jgi:flagellar basal body-associated protein FliL
METMSNISIITLLGGCVVFLLGAVTWFLNRLINQNDETHRENQKQFRELIDEVKEVRSTLHEHKGDMLVVKEQITFHTDKLKDVNTLFERIRDVNERLIEIETTNQLRAAH